MSVTSRLLGTLGIEDADSVLHLLKEKSVKIDLFLFDDYFEIHKEYLKTLDQKEELCGPFSLTYILRALGYKTHKGKEVNQDYCGYLVRANISREHIDKLESLRKEIKELQPKGIMRLKEENRGIWYQYDMRPFVTDSPIEAGSSAQGVLYAAETITDKKIRVIPVPALRKGKGILLTKDKFDALLDLLEKTSKKWMAQAILNVNTGYLLDPNTIKSLSRKLILNIKVPETLKNRRKPVGHFVSCGGIVKIIPRNEQKKRLLIIRETFRDWGENHLQRAEDIRKALIREDGREGGILLLVDHSEYEEAQESISDLGLSIELWDNGSPFGRR